jgi:hypothetical protein
MIGLAERFAIKLNLPPIRAALDGDPILAV